MKIAIDGPAGAGKSSIAKLVAEEISFVYVDTGAMFRTIAYYFLTNGIDPADEAAVKADCEQIQIGIEYKEGEQHIFLNGTDVSKEIRQEEVGKNASVVARYGCVREKLLQMQRELAEKSNVIMDGRDIGTVVLPDAEVKIYLTASSLVRAKRRYAQLQEKGEDCNLEEIEKDIIARDEQDMNRAIAPLRQAEDAILVDTSDMTIPEVVARIRALAEEAGA
ncbi:MAG: (d)CMP kinase [Lachnospiraceae bacterium]|nr:(d)CMP kinase [Lachnospiraceae bacterium]